MSVNDRSRFWSPAFTYEFELKVGNLDLTPDLISVSILTSIDFPYQVFSLHLYRDSVEMILDKVYGQTPLQLRSKLFGTSAGVPQEVVNFDLMYLASDMPVEVTLPQGSVDQDRSRDPINITCVARKPFRTMNFPVAGVFHQQSISSILSSLVSKTGASIKLDSMGINQTPIDQVLIPTSTLYNNIKYLNRTFGIFDGMPAIFCSHDNVVHVKNLTRKIKTGESFIIYQLPLAIDNSEIIEKCNDGKRFYTIRDVQTRYRGNASMAYIAPKMRHVVKPSDRLYHVIDIDVENFLKEYALVSRDTTFHFDKENLGNDKRVSYHKDHTGYETEQTFINSRYGTRFGNTSEITVHIERSFKILNLMNVGECVKMDFRTSEYTELGGNYILRASNLNFIRGKDWESSGDLYLIRTNRTV